MTSTDKQRICDTFCRILESQTFMFAEAAEDLPEPGDDLLCASIRFSGHFTGSLSLAVTGDTSIEMAANVLGLDPDDELARQRGADAFKEMLNVACGNLLTTIAGDEPVFDLWPPQISGLDQTAWEEAAAHADSIPLLIDMEPAILTMTWEQAS